MDKFYKDENGVIDFPLAVQQKFHILNEEKALLEHGKRGGNLNSGQIFRFSFNVDSERMEKAIQRLFDENDALRLILVKKDGEYFQRVVEDYNFTLETDDLTSLPEDGRYDAAVAKASDLLNTEIDYYNELSAKFHLIKLGDEDFMLVIVAHHWIGDGSTLALIISEIMKYYNDPSAAKEEAASFIDFVKYEYDFVDSEKGRKQLAYWKEELDGYKQLDLSNAAAGDPAVPSDQFAKAGRTELDAAAKRFSTSQFNVMLTAYHVALTKILGQSDTIVGFSCANRLSKRFFRTIGYLSRAVQHRLIVHDSDRLCDLLETSKEKSSKNIANQQTSHYNDNSQFYISYQNFSVNGNKGFGEKVKAVQIPVKRVLDFFTMLVFENENDLNLMFAGDENKFTSDFIKRLMAYCMTTIKLLSEKPEVTVGEIDRFL